MPLYPESPPYCLLGQPESVVLIRWILLVHLPWILFVNAARRFNYIITLPVSNFFLERSLLEPIVCFIEIYGVDICFFEWGERGTPQLLLVHATGFHSRCWDQIVKKLPNGLNVFCVDMRGHGRSEKTGPYSWDRFGTDLLRFCEAVNLCDAVGVGHSMGGYCVTHVAAQNNSHFKQLLMVDPVIMEPSVYKNSERHKFDSVGDHPVARRKAVFKDAQEMYARYKDRMPYKLWQDGVFKDYCDFKPRIIHLAKDNSEYQK